MVDLKVNSMKKVYFAFKTTGQGSPASSDSYLCSAPFVKPRGGGGVLAVYMTGAGGSDVIIWVESLHPRYFFGSRDLSRIFLGLKVCLIE